MKREYNNKDEYLVENIPHDYSIKEHIEDSFVEYNSSLNENNISGIFRKIKINGISIDYIDVRHKVGSKKRDVPNTVVAKLI